LHTVFHLGGQSSYIKSKLKPKRDIFDIKKKIVKRCHGTRTGILKAVSTSFPVLLATNVDFIGERDQNDVTPLVYLK
jgi:hypothetical protein